MIELARSSVQTWECDQMGHMNVQFYVEKAGDALSVLAAKIGLGPKALARDGLVLEPCDQHMRFLRELRPGTPFYLRGGVVTADVMALTSYVELVQTANGEVSATFRSVSQLRDVHSHSIEAFDDGARAMAQHVLCEIPGHAAPRGLTLYEPRPAPKLEHAEQLGLLTTFQGVVRPWECDAHGIMQPRFYMARVSDAIPNLIVQTSGRNRGQDEKTGGAALEYRFVFRKSAKSGDILVVKSGLRALNDKTYVWTHWLFDAETGEALATSEAVAVALDLVARKAIPLPAELRAQLEKLLIPGLTV